MKRLPISMAWMCCVMTCFLASYAMASGVDIDRMTKEQLKARINDTALVVIDARSGRDWKSSEFKIKGAVRQGKDIVKWAEAAGYSKDMVMVLYCA